MSNRLPQYSMSGGGSNNSGQYASQIYTSLSKLPTGSTTDPLAAMTTPVLDPESGQPIDIGTESSYTSTTLTTVQTARSARQTQDVDNSGATIEVITVEKYKRTDGFANPYHIQGLNASTPDDVDDDDDDEEELDPEAQLIDEADLSFDTTLEYQKGQMTVDVNDPDEVTLKQEFDGDEMLSIPMPPTEASMQPPIGSLPASNDSSVTSVSPVMSVASSHAAVPSQILTPRCEVINRTSTEGSRMLQFTVERVPSEEKNDAQSIVDIPQDRLTPPMPRVNTTDSMQVHEVDKSNAEDQILPVESILSNEQPNKNWINPASAQTEHPSLPPWTSAEVSTNAAAVTTVASSVPTSHVNGQPSAAPINMPTSHAFGVAPAPNVPIMPMSNMMMPSSNELSNFPSAAPHVDLKAPFSATNEPQQPMLAAFNATQNVVHDRGSTPSPGPPTQPSVPSPPHPQAEALPQMIQSIDGSPPVVCENDDVEIRFRRARFLEKREQWIGGSILVVDTFRREEPVTRPEINLPDPSFPFHCLRCTRRHDGKTQKGLLLYILSIF